MINNNSIELAAKQVQAEEEPFVLALPVMFGEKSSCAGICDRLTTQYNKEKKQYSINMSHDVGDILDKLSLARNENKNAIVEALIRAEYNKLPR